MKDNVIKGASILTAILMFSMLLSPVLAAPPQPNNRWGYASDGAGVLPNGELITAWVDGVQYGDDLTVDGTGLFSVDTLGDTDYGLGTEKDGGLIGEFIQYVHGDLTSASGGVFMTGVSVPEPWIPGGFEVFAEDLVEDAASPALLKISKISVAPIPYLGIYDASGAATITDYAFDINNAGAVQIATGDILGTVGLITYINPTSFGGIANDDALTLSENATGYIVDRVEFGIINVEPQETIMTNAVNPAAGMEIHRTPADGTDTNACLVDFTPGAVTWPAGDLATATGVTNSPLWTNVALTDITYTVSGTPPSVDLYYTTDNGASWSASMNDVTPDGTYPFTCPADGQYAYWAVAVGGIDVAPVPGNLPEHAGTYNYDGTAPTGVNAGLDLGDIGTTPTQQNGANAGDSSISGQASLVWTQTGGPGVVTFAPSNLVINPTVSASLDGLYTCRLTITDNAGNSAWDEFTFTWTSGGVVTYWDLYNGQNYRTFSSTQTFADSEFLAVDVISYINTNYGEGLVNEDVEIFRYNSVTGLFERTYWWAAFTIWWGQFALIEGDTYIVQIAPGSLSVQPRVYELPNFALTVETAVNIYNGQNYRGFPVTTFADSEALAVDIISYINTNYGEALVNEDVEIFRYNSVTGLFERTYWWAAFTIWWGQFPMNPGVPADGEGYIVQIAPGALSIQPRLYTPS